MSSDSFTIVVTTLLLMMGSFSLNEVITDVKQKIANWMRQFNLETGRHGWRQYSQISPTPRQGAPVPSGLYDTSTATGWLITFLNVALVPVVQHFGGEVGHPSYVPGDGLPGN